MNKKELWKNLSAGKKLMDVLLVVDGQDCLIVSVTDKEYEDSKDDDIVYIPDFDLSQLPRPIKGSRLAAGPGSANVAPKRSPSFEIREYTLMPPHRRVIDKTRH